MVAAQHNANGVAKLLIEAKADVDAKNKVRPVGRCTFVAVTHCRRDWVRSMDPRR